MTNSTPTTDRIALAGDRQPSKSNNYKWEMKGLVSAINSSVAYTTGTGYVSNVAEGIIDMWFGFVPHNELEAYLASVETSSCLKIYIKKFLANNGTCHYGGPAWRMLAPHLVAFGKVKIKVAV